MSHLQNSVSFASGLQFFGQKPYKTAFLSEALTKLKFCKSLEEKKSRG